MHLALGAKMLVRGNLDLMSERGAMGDMAVTISALIEPREKSFLQVF